LQEVHDARTTCRVPLGIRRGAPRMARGARREVCDARTSRSARLCEARANSGFLSALRPARGCPRRASSDSSRPPARRQRASTGCSSLSSTTSGESSRCAPRPRGALPSTPVHATTRSSTVTCRRSSTIITSMRVTGSTRRGNRAVVGGAVSASLVGLALFPLAAAASCDGHECDASVAYYGCDGTPAGASATCCPGLMLDDTHWASSPQEDANWLPFPANGTLVFYLSGWTNAPPDTAFSTVQIASAQGSSDPDPVGDSPIDASSFWTNGSGSLSEWVATGTDPSYVGVTNATCSPWVARVVIGFDSPLDGGPLARGPCWKAQLARDQ
jgi:hypothetical protein